VIARGLGEDSDRLKALKVEGAEMNLHHSFFGLTMA
jgi:hypothetical protein